MAAFLVVLVVAAPVLLWQFFTGALAPRRYPACRCHRNERRRINPNLQRAAHDIDRTARRAWKREVA